MAHDVRQVDLSYDNANSRESAIRLVTTLFPEWESTKDTIEFIRFTDGITNTLMKAENRKPGLSRDEIDHESVLLRAYGRGTAVLIDRDRECASHSLLASHKLAPPLLARFNNGLLYRFIQGKVCSPDDLRKPEIWRGVARRLAEWHATIPTSSVFKSSANRHTNGPSDTQFQVSNLPSPNIWTVMHRWATALPSSSPTQQSRKSQLLSELAWLTNHLATQSSNVTGIDPLVFSHCDLLSGNVIIQANPAESTSASTTPHSISSPSSPTSATSTLQSDPATSPAATVSFIDYEYATPAPAAFDIANHFAEWGGFECDFTVLPTRSQRRDFLTAYLAAYRTQSGLPGRVSVDEEQLGKLMDEVDRFRGAPGFYWGIWALIQAEISQIDFDYAGYAEVRLGEYWAWKRSVVDVEETEGDGQVENGKVREGRWAQEE